MVSPFQQYRRPNWFCPLLDVLHMAVLCWALAGCYVDSPPLPPEEISSRLVMLLTDRDPDVRRTAAEALGKLGVQSAAPHLIAAVGDGDPRVRAAAALALGRIGHREAGVALAGTLADPSTAVQEAGALAMGQLDTSPAVQEQLGLRLRASQASTRLAATLALLGQETVPYSPGLLAGLRDSNPSVRQGTVALLGETGDVRVGPSLLTAATTDKDPRVRAEAVYRLGKVGNTESVATLTKVAENDEDPSVRRWAGWALEQIKPRPASGSTH